jgi:hypothetical protein
MKALSRRFAGRNPREVPVIVREDRSALGLCARELLVVGLTACPNLMRTDDVEPRLPQKPRSDRTDVLLKVQSRRHL